MQCTARRSVWGASAARRGTSPSQTAFQRAGRRRARRPCGDGRRRRVAVAGWRGPGLVETKPPTVYCARTHRHCFSSHGLKQSVVKRGAGGVGAVLFSSISFFLLAVIFQLQGPHRAGRPTLKGHQPRSPIKHLQALRHKFNASALRTHHRARRGAGQVVADAAPCAMADQHAANQHARQRQRARIVAAQVIAHLSFPLIVSSSRNGRLEEHCNTPKVAPAKYGSRRRRCNCSKTDWSSLLLLICSSSTAPQVIAPQHQAIADCILVLETRPTRRYRVQASCHLPAEQKLGSWTGQTTRVSLL